MTEPQKKLASYIVNCAGNSYVMTNYTKRCIVGMLEGGEISRSDFCAIKNGDKWLEEIEQYAKENGWEIPCK